MTRRATPEQALEAARAFKLSGTPQGAASFGSGHIHETFSVRCDNDSDELRYALQRINTSVFEDPEAVVANAALITDTVRAGLERRGIPDVARRCLRCIETRSGGWSHTDSAGGIWRASLQILGACTYDTVDSPEQARRAAFAFGDFAALLANLDPAALALTIPGFHDFEARFGALELAVANDARGRATAAARDIDGFREARSRLQQELPAAALAELPIRVVHNDCKLNNVLFDEQTGDALCVIDLDTAMPGNLLGDFGDLVRTAVCDEPEDSRALERIRVDPVLYAALAHGYLDACAELLTVAERELLAVAGPLITLETGFRFLADHLDGDRYFRITREGHNLDRARTQLRLTEELLDDLEGARRLIQGLRAS